MRCILLQLVLFHFTFTFDPCTDYTPKNDDGGRSTQCSGGSDKCDRYLLNGWYQVFVDGVSVFMPTTPVPINSCSSVFPVWLNGTYPTIGDGIVTMTACTTTAATDCGDSYSIQVQNCSSFYVFNLVATKGCPERYCFGDDICPTTTSTTTSTTTTTTTTITPTATSIPPTQTSTTDKNNGSIREGQEAEKVALVVSLTSLVLFVLLVVSLAVIYVRCTRNSTIAVSYPREDTNKIAADTVNQSVNTVSPTVITVKPSVVNVIVSPTVVTVESTPNQLGIESILKL